MKINTLKKTKGLTLIELTVVIVVLLGLISVLFISARAWIEGSNRAKCIVNLSSIQKAAGSYFNMKNQTAPVLQDLIDEKMIPNTMRCPQTSGLNVAADYNLDTVSVTTLDTVLAECLKNGTGTGTGDHILTF